MLEVQATIIGGGIVGCCIADRLAAAGVETVLLEKESALARGTTSRNSEVAHGGMYYPTGSLKASCCVRGRHLLKSFCEEARVRYRECGKLIVATSVAEIPRLEELLARGEANGVEDLRLVDGAELERLEPDVAAVAGLLSPRTGVLDAEGAAKAYAARAGERGAQILTGAAATAVERVAGAWQITVRTGDGRREGWSHRSRVVINAAGLFADRIAALSGAPVDELGWRLVPSKGNYFRIDPRHAGRVGRLIYPVPPADGTTLGTHLCLDLDGQLRLGPDFETLPARGKGELPDLLDETWDYRVDPARLESFHRDAVRFLPWLRREDLGPDQCGIRPKLSTSEFRDFVVHDEGGSRAGWVQLIGIDSPGLTSAPALAEEVAARVIPHLD